MNDNLEYVAKWFSYHANQRLVAFNFFIILLSALCVGIATSIQIGKSVLGIVLSGFGFIFSILFLLLEKRNKELMTYGADTLRKEEAKLPEDFRFNTKREDSKTFVKHGYVIPFIFWITISVFLFSTIYFCAEIRQTTERETKVNLQTF